MDQHTPEASTKRFKISWENTLTQRQKLAERATELLYQERLILIPSSPAYWKGGTRPPDRTAHLNEIPRSRA